MVCHASTKERIPLDVYGDGPLMNYLRERFGTSPWIQFHGYINDPWELIGRNKILVSCSKHEGDGRVIAEAIIQRQPILLIDTPDHRKFHLPEHHYFSNIGELMRILSTHKDALVNSLRPPVELSNKEILNRDPLRVATVLMKKLTALYGAN